MVDVKCLSDSELQYELDRLGFSPGPILPSTRKVYEKKLVQLLVSASCAPLVTSRTWKQDAVETCDDSEEVNATIILKGNIILSKEKVKELKRNPVFEIQEQQEDTVKPNFDCKIVTKASTTKLKTMDLGYLGHQGLRCPTRMSITLGKERCISKEKDTMDRDKQELFPVGLKLAVFGIFIIVVFVYITVEKPLLG
ncbi:LEM domain-containing protein 1 [Erinaceus europaeus]|uniref:LEM domain-containing protein 1 n=1 Tax=Erinaceus europaeus TaxID=9365 RepID=A0ABM3WDN6_ERIEU|nr:LEM domain-containing protein 1 [Erinaceus europaeus]